MMCPAVRLAANRKERVMGRTLILRVSIITKKGFSQFGAPPGRRLAVKDIGAWVALDRIKDNHRGRPRDRVIIKCVDKLNVYGIRPIKLVAINSIKSAVMIVENLFKCPPNVRSVCELMISRG